MTELRDKEGAISKVFNRSTNNQHISCSNCEAYYFGVS